MVGVLALSAVLEVHRLSANGFANVYYSAGVRSMLGSLHNFAYLAFDPGGLVSLDKPPIAPWTQAISAWMFGLDPLSLLIPEALAVVAAVAVVYRAVSRRFGAWTGVLAAATLATFPAFVAVGRDNNPDAMLILLMTLAAAAGVSAAETGRRRTLLACGVLIGLAFNTKALAAYLLVPSLALGYLACAPVPRLRRLLDLAIAGLAVAVVSVAWLSFVELTPASQRPFVGDTTDNSEFGLTLGYNGLGRVGGQNGGPGRVPHIVPRHPARGTRQAARPSRSSVPTAFSGPAGPTRLLGVGLGSQGGWMLPLAVLGTLALALSLSGRGDPRLAFLIVIGGWFAIEALILSFSKGIIHPYYSSALAPSVAALTGAGAASILRRGAWERWRLAIGAGALGATAVVEIVLLGREHYLDWWPPILAALVAVSIVAGAVAAAARHPAARWALVVGLVALLVAPGAFSTTVWHAPVEGTFPAAGLHQLAGHGGVGLTPAGARQDRSLMRYLRLHRPGRRFELLTVSSVTAAPMILLGLRAASLAGYGGTDPVLDGRSLGRLVAQGLARHVLLGGIYSARGGNRAIDAVIGSCRAVSPAQWQPADRPHPQLPDSPAVRTVELPGTSTPGHVLLNLTLFDCAGRGRQLAGTTKR
jgi:4-amino-4-deoxy-L-arabinose transferase-like glycosyltransferase